MDTATKRCWRRAPRVDADRCEALWLKARALGKLRARGDAAMAYAEFIGACGDDPRALDAAFARGKGLFTADANDAAITALAVFDTHPEGPLADDALYITARIHAQVAALFHKVCDTFQKPRSGSEFIGACGDDPRALDAAFARGKGPPIFIRCATPFKNHGPFS